MLHKGDLKALVSSKQKKKTTQSDTKYRNIYFKMQKSETVQLVTDIRKNRPLQCQSSLYIYIAIGYKNTFL